MIIDVLRRRPLLATIIVLVFSVTAVIIYILSHNNNASNKYYSPHDVTSGKVPAKGQFSIEGIVVKGSYKKLGEGGLNQFMLSGGGHRLTVRSELVMPDIFTEGEPVVAKGMLNKEGIFIARYVLVLQREPNNFFYTPQDIANKNMPKKKYFTGGWGLTKINSCFN